MKTELILTFLAIAVSGCAGQTVWVKPGVTQYQFENDRNQCLGIANAELRIKEEQDRQKHEAGLIRDGTPTTNISANMAGYSMGQAMNRTSRMNLGVQRCLSSRGYYKEGATPSKPKNVLGG